jgi:NADH-quinone oxidoreductase subunit L
MEGPTPVSALIHAATMVAAGVYLLCRVFFLFNGTALVVIAWIGAITAFLAATIALQQNDIKRILAYSTLSQLGYMVMAVGLHGPAPAMYHLTTHAFFKALLFLAAGSVILASHHEQDIWRLGGLRRKMPITFWTFFLASLALCGVPPFSGYFSKDEILAQAYLHNGALFAVGVATAALTTFYMFRLILVVFQGRSRSEGARHARESERVVTFPLLILVIPSVLAGFWGVDAVFGRQFLVAESPSAHSWFGQVMAPIMHAPAVGLFGLLAVGIGFAAAWGLYRNADEDPLPEALGGLARAMENRFYFDELYAGAIRVTHDALARVSEFIDRWIVDGLMVRGLSGATDLVGRTLRLVQTGNLRTYAFFFVVGTAVLFYFAVRN